MGIPLLLVVAMVPSAAAGSAAAGSAAAAGSGGMYGCVGGTPGRMSLGASTLRVGEGTWVKIPAEVTSMMVLSRMRNMITLHKKRLTHVMSIHRQSFFKQLPKVHFDHRDLLRSILKAPTTNEQEIYTTDQY
jgi:hypothetical protein